MDAYIPWAMLGVSGAALYLEKVMRGLHERIQSTSQAPEKFPVEVLEQLCDRMASKRLHLWLLLVAGAGWLLLDQI